MNRIFAQALAPFAPPSSEVHELAREKVFERQEETPVEVDRLHRRIDIDYQMQISPMKDEL